jgi:hypothetical protein
MSETTVSDPHRCGFVGSSCWSDETRGFFETTAFLLALSSLVFLAMNGGWAILGLALPPEVAEFAAQATGILASVAALGSAQTGLQRGLALAALATVAFVSPASFAPIVWGSLWVSIAITKYVADKANS